MRIRYYVKNLHQMQIFHMEVAVIIRQRYLDELLRFRDQDLIPLLG